MPIQTNQVSRIPRRLDAMIRRSEEFKGQFAPGESIYQLLNKFGMFAREYIELLKHVPETICRNSFVVNNGIEKLLQEWNVLSRASEQRVIGEFKHALEKASNQARAYCDKWNNILADSPYRKLEIPVVYFEKLFRISRSIYASHIPVISIPLTDYDQPENWQSLAHEFSHHIFWNGFSPDESGGIQEKINSSITPELFSPAMTSARTSRGRSPRQREIRAALWKMWLEEVFADVYGTLLAGSSYAISAQERMAEQVNRRQDFLMADHHHPCVFLRPYIALYTLECVADHRNAGYSEVETLKLRWSEFADQASQLKYQGFTLESLAEDARKIVEILLRGDYWPVRFDPIEKLAVSIEAMADLAPLESAIDEDPLEQVYADLESITLPTTFEEIKSQLLKTCAIISQQMENKQPQEGAKMLAWSSLAGLELGDFRNYHVHGCTNDHRHVMAFWLSGHWHPDDGSAVLSC